MLKWLRSIDWAAIVGSALALAFGMLVVIPAVEQPRQAADANASEQAPNPDEVPWWDRADFWEALFTGLIAIYAIRQFSEGQRAGTEQLKLTKESIDLARDEFNATHRPKFEIALIMRLGFFENNPVKIRWTLINTGTGRGRVIESNATAIFAKQPLPARPRYSSERATMNPEQTWWIDPGFTRTFTQHFNISSEDWAVYQVSRDYGTSPENLYFIGYVLYEASDGKRRSIAFCRCYDDVSERFIVVHDPNYEHGA